jgi:hypothetical protein
MAVVLAVASLVLFVSAITSPPPEPSLQMLWRNDYSVRLGTSGESARPTSDGGFVIAGSFYRLWQRIWFAKVDASGKNEWNRTFANNQVQCAMSVDQSSDGGYVLAAWTAVPPLGLNESVLLVKTDSSGNGEWNMSYGEPGDRWPASVRQTLDNGYIVVGWPDLWIIKTDSSGSLEWNKTYPSDDHYGDIFGRHIEPTVDGGYIVLSDTLLDYAIDGYTTSVGGSWVLKIDSTGTPQWNKTFVYQSIQGGYDYQNCRLGSIHPVSDGGYLGSGSSNSRAWLVKLNSSGGMEWNASCTNEGFQVADDVQQTRDGGYVALTKSSWNGQYHTWLWKTDAAGQTTWCRSLGEFISSCLLYQTTDAGYVVAGYTSLGGGRAPDYPAIIVKVSGTPQPIPYGPAPVLYASSGIIGVLCAMVGVQEWRNRR